MNSNELEIRRNYLFPLIFDWKDEWDELQERKVDKTSKIYLLAE